MIMTMIMTMTLILMFGAAGKKSCCELSEWLKRIRAGVSRRMASSLQSLATQRRPHTKDKAHHKALQPRPLLPSPPPQHQLPLPPPFPCQRRRLGAKGAQRRGKRPLSRAKFVAAKLLGAKSLKFVSLKFVGVKSLKLLCVKGRQRWGEMALVVQPDTPCSLC
jgi:hypothetical protein